MSKVPGVGKAKLERYGNIFLEVILEHFPPEKSVSKLMDDDSAPVVEGLKPQEVADKRELSVGTIYSHCVELIQHGDITVSEATGLRDDEIELIEKSYESLADEDKSKLKPLFLVLDKRYSYELIRCVLAGLES